MLWIPLRVDSESMSLLSCPFCFDLCAFVWFVLQVHELISYIISHLIDSISSHVCLKTRSSYLLSFFHLSKTQTGQQSKANAKWQTNNRSQTPFLHDAAQFILQHCQLRICYCNRSNVNTMGAPTPGSKYLPTSALSSADFAPVIDKAVNRSP